MQFFKIFTEVIFIFRIFDINTFSVPIPRGIYYTLHYNLPMRNILSVLFSFYLFSLRMNGIYIVHIHFLPEVEFKHSILAFQSLLRFLFIEQITLRMCGFPHVFVICPLGLFWSY